MEPNPVVHAARLQDTDAITPILREPIGKNTAGGTSAANDKIESFVRHGDVIKREMSDPTMAYIAKAQFVRWPRGKATSACAR
jgi:hypothetical protein